MVCSYKESSSQQSNKGTSHWCGARTDLRNVLRDTPGTVEYMLLALFL